MDRQDHSPSIQSPSTAGDDKEMKQVHFWGFTALFFLGMAGLTLIEMKQVEHRGDCTHWANTFAFECE